jgi:hypothetical protein
MENGTKGKRQLLFVCRKQKTETVNFLLFAANGNGKQKIVSLVPINSLVLRPPSTNMLPFPLHVGPQLNIQHALKKTVIPVNSHGLSMPLLRGPGSLSTSYYGLVLRASLHMDM